MKHKINKKLIVLTSLIYFPISLILTILLTNQIKIFTENLFVGIYVDLAAIVFLTIALIESVFKFITGRNIGGIIYLFGGIKNADGVYNGIDGGKKVFEKIRNNTHNKIKKRRIENNMINWFKKNWKNILIFISNIAISIVGIVSFMAESGFVIIVNGFNILPFISIGALFAINIIATLIDPFHKGGFADILNKFKGLAKEEYEKQKSEQLALELAEAEKLALEKVQAKKIAKAKLLIEKEKSDALAKELAEKEAFEIKELAEKMKAEDASTAKDNSIR